MEENIAVLGLGLNGLASAYALARNQIHSTIFDENPFKYTFKDDLRTSFISKKTLEMFPEISENIIQKSGKIDYIFTLQKNDSWNLSPY